MKTAESGTERSERRGGALTLVLLMMVVLTVSLAAAFRLSSVELRVADDHTEQMEAFALAESGRELFIANRASLGFVGVPAASESARVNLTGGYADVVLKQIRPAGASTAAIYVLRSVGVRGVARRHNVPPATRTVAEYVSWQSGSMAVLAAWTSLTGLHKNGGSGTISGTDACGLAAAVSGVAVPNTPGYTQNGGSSVPSGNPPINNLGTQQQANDAINVDWAGITAGTALSPDIVIPGNSWPSFSNANYWPTILATGNFTLPGSGRGLLVVTGNFTISGSNTWDGIVLVGANITSNGNNKIRGAVLSGLNEKLGVDVPNGALGNGNKLFQYNSCNVANALAGLGGLVPYKNAWLDNWAGY